MAVHSGTMHPDAEDSQTGTSTRNEPGNANEDYGMGSRCGKGHLGEVQTSREVRSREPATVAAAAFSAAARQGGQNGQSQNVLEPPGAL
ncbi:hypothetical protein MRX96_059684 [Rhipicephalus microplus]